ncbi:MAG: 2-hydroxyacyl-CoA dehydratase [Planctomycetota bacterium]
MPERRIGITATVPVEILLAADRVPVDLNNLFISEENPEVLLSRVEDEGFPQNYCAWIKGIYAVAMRDRFEEVLIVTQGDCSNSLALSELLTARGIRIHTFAYPYSRDRRLLKAEMERLAGSLGTDLTEALKWLHKLSPIRENLRELDRMTWEDCRISGAENLHWLVSSSDFRGNPEKFGAELEDFLENARNREAAESRVRLALAGVPPILKDIYEVAANLGAEIVLNEMPRQFSMPSATDSLTETYTGYTYPYDIFHRLEDLARELERRKVDGLLHYAQSFCYRQLGEMIMRERLDVPILTVEADRPACVSDALKTRVEAFIEMLKA